MLFNSSDFLIFFPIVVSLYFLMPYRFRWTLLLGGSYYFYMCWKPEFIILIIISTFIDYYCGLKMGRTKEKKKRKKFLLLSLFVNLGMLFFFKYFNFFSVSVHDFCNSINIFYDMPAFKVLLPVGISFYTFQTLSYTIDVYKGEKTPEKHLGIFALYVAFFPQLVAGPIERSTCLLPQFFEKHEFSYNRVVSGLRLMLWGFYKKVVVADSLAPLVDGIFDNPEAVTDIPGIGFTVATVLFAFQIFCDFSGYSDIAIGTSRVLGYRLMKNFNRPYYSKSIGEFWGRWHISLSTWFRDYVYIPLGGNRTSKMRYYANLIIVFLVSGLWHGANWTFVAWGALHGTYLVTGIWTFRLRSAFVKKIHLSNFPFLLKCSQVAITFAMVCLAWIFFRAQTVGEAFFIIRNLFTGYGEWIQRWIQGGEGKLSPFYLGQPSGDLYRAVLAIALMEAVHLLQRKEGFGERVAQMPFYLRWPAYYLFAFLILAFWEKGGNEFIYFQF